MDCVDYPDPANSDSTRCEHKCSKAASICRNYIGPLSAPPAILFEMSCVRSGLAAPVCMSAVNTAQGLAVAQVLAQCDKAESICKKNCNSQCDGSE